MREILFDRGQKTIEEVLKADLAEGEAIKPILSAQCESWWRCRIQQIDNGMVDTFTCKKKVCTDVILQRPYSIDDLQAAVKKHCTGAQSDSQYCGECEWR